MRGVVTSVCVLVWILGEFCYSRSDWHFCESPPSTRIFHEKERDRLKCNGCPGDQGLVFSWHEPVLFSDEKGAVYPNSSTLYMAGPDLLFSYVSRDFHEKLFRCEARNVSDPSFDVVSRTSKVFVYWIDETSRVEVKGNYSFAIEGQVTLDCQVTGYPTPTVIWYRNGQRQYDTRTVKIKSDGTLKIKTLQAGDTGVYTCSANNSLGRTELEYGVAVGINDSLLPLTDLKGFPTEVIGRRDATLEVTCPLLNKTAVVWTAAGKSIGTTKTRFEIATNGSLIIEKFRKADVGSYECFSRGDEVTSTFAISVHIAKIKRLDASSLHSPNLTGNQLIVAAGQKAEITCTPSGSFPTPTVRWLLNGAPVAVDHMVAVRTLTIRQASTGAQGMLTCLAENVAGQRGYNISYLVTVPPRIIQQPVTVNVKEGNSARFTCYYQGNTSLSTITWIIVKEKEEIITQDYPSVRINHTSGVLLFQSVQLDDSGMVFCVVSTKGQVPVTSRRARLRVLRALSILQLQTDRQLKLGAQEKVVCSAVAETEPVISWLYLSSQSDGNTVSTELPAGVTSHHGTLIFKNVTKGMAGQYMCVATSSPEVVNVTVTITTGLPPVILKKLNNQVAYFGKEVSFTCNTTGDPSPTVHWWKDGEALNYSSHSKYHLLKGGKTLHIFNVSYTDAGSYSCLAGSSMGFARSEANLRVGSSLDDYRGGLTATSEGLTLQHTIIIAVTSAVVYLILVVVMTVWCSARLVKKKKKAQEAERAALEGRKENGNIEATEGDQLIGSISKNKCNSNGRPNGKPNGYPMITLHSGEDFSALGTGSQKSAISSASKSAASSAEKTSFSDRPTVVRCGAPRSDIPLYPRANLELIGLLGKGVYGNVFLAKAAKLEDDKGPQLVYVKALSSRADSHEEMYREEAYMYHQLSHQSICRFYALCTEVEPTYMIMEYCEWGDLKQFLLTTVRSPSLTPNTAPPPQPPSVHQRMVWLHQLAAGMNHMAHSRLVHGDLAARNVLLSPSMDVKIASLSLARDVYANEYFELPKPAKSQDSRETGAEGRHVPLRWMAPDIYVADGHPTMESDVWSFGVLAWEIFADASLPYAHWSDSYVEDAYRSFMSGLARNGAVAAAISGGTNGRGLISLEAPKGLVTMVAQCWTEAPGDRPRFTEVVTVLSELVMAVHADTSF